MSWARMIPCFLQKRTTSLKNASDAVAAVGLFG